MTMTPKERVLAAMKQESLDRPPVAIFTQSATLGQMEKTGAAWPEAHKNAELMAKLGAAQADMFGFECCRAPFCLTAESERLGATVQVEKKDAAPMIKAHPFKFDPMTSEYDDPANLMSPEEFVQGGRPAVAIQAIELLAKSHGENYAIVAGNTGPFTLTGNLVNTENLVFGMMMCPEEVDKWVDAVNPIVTAYTHALMDAGADVVQCSEPSGSTDMLAPDMFDEAAGHHVKTALKPKDGKYTVLHICGDTYPILDQMAATESPESPSRRRSTPSRLSRRSAERPSWSETSDPSGPCSREPLRRPSREPRSPSMPDSTSSPPDAESLWPLPMRT